MTYEESLAELARLERMVIAAVRRGFWADAKQWHTEARKLRREIHLLPDVRNTGATS